MEQYGFASVALFPTPRSALVKQTCQSHFSSTRSSFNTNRRTSGIRNKSNTIVPVHMNSPPPEGNIENKTDAESDASDKPPKADTNKDDDDSGVSFWGVASFAIIFLIFMAGIVATLARDFIPGGMTSPVS